MNEAGKALNIMNMSGYSLTSGGDRSQNLFVRSFPRKRRSVCARFVVSPLVDDISPPTKHANRTCGGESDCSHHPNVWRARPFCRPNTAPKNNKRIRDAQTIRDDRMTPERHWLTENYCKLGEKICPLPQTLFYCITVAVTDGRSSASRFAANSG